MHPAWKNSNSNEKYCHHFKKEKKMTISFLKKNIRHKTVPIKCLLYGML